MPPTNPPDIAALLGKLRARTRVFEDRIVPIPVPINPDGPEAATTIQSLQAENAALRKATRLILPYLEWTIGPESPGHHPTMPSAVAAFRSLLSPEAPHDE